MKINGVQAVEYLSTISDRISLHKKDNTDKLWCYKLNTGKKTEFAFDPKTTDGLNVRVDRHPPEIVGINVIKRISGIEVSAALGRVFSGGFHKANFVATIETLETLEKFIEHYESL